MHPSIRAFPSQAFYEGRITDDTSVLTRSLSCRLLQEMALRFEPLTFFDLKSSQESADETSKTNREEALFIINMLQVLCTKVQPPELIGEVKGRIGIITPYKAQVRLIKDLLAQWLRGLKGINTRGDIEVNTVDAFQGQEKDVIIMSCVRANQSASLKGSLGFLVDERRMNVAITRAKHFLFVVGNSRTLGRNEKWQGLIKACRLVTYDSPAAYSVQ